MMVYDVIVCGAGPSGVAAAISAKRNGSSVLLIESSGLLGGSSVQSLAGPWMTYHYGSKQIIRGIAGEIADILAARGYSPSHIEDPIGFVNTITPFDVEGMKEVFFDLIQAENVDLLLHAFIFDVIKDQKAIKGVKVATKSGILDFMGKVIIDATGDGDIAAKMGCEFVYGRASDHIAQPMTMIFSVGNVDVCELKSYVQKNPDDFVQKELYKGDYLAISGFFSKVEEARRANDFSISRDRVLLFQEVRPNQVSINMTRVLNHSGIDAFSLSQAEMIGRNQIKEVFRFLKKYVPGFEDSFILRTPSKIGVRETRHIMGEYVMDSCDIIEEKTFSDSICVSAFPIDIHSPEKATLDVDEKSYHKCYEIPLRVMIPKTIEQLVVTGRAVSATHEANASMRVTPSVMALGEAAGVLASLASSFSVSPREIDYRLVQDILIRRGQIIHRDVVSQLKE